jgi:hypothetical protein
MPITVFESKGISATRRERIQAAVESGGSQVAGTHEAWIAADAFRGGFKVLITGPQGFERTLVCAFDDDPAMIPERVRETLDEMGRFRALPCLAPNRWLQLLASRRFLLGMDFRAEGLDPFLPEVLFELSAVHSQVILAQPGAVGKSLPILINGRGCSLSSASW